MFSGCFSAWRWSSVITPPTTSEQHQGVPPEASMSDYVQAPLHSSKTSDIPSAQRATATPSPPEHFAAAKIAGRRATNWEDSMPETGGTRGSASCIAGRRATEMDGTSRDRPAGPPPDDRGSRAVHTVTGANTRREKNNVGLRQKSSASKDVRPLPNISVRSFTFGELAEATLNFSPERFLGEGGYGRVYKGRLDNGQLVAVKHLANNCNRAFLTEVLTPSLLYHPNVVNMIGYVADGDQRLLVYEYMPLGSLEDHLHDLPLDREPLDWKTRMKIAAGAARGLEYLHNKARPSIIHRDVKPSNILLDEEYHPKLSDFGLAKLAPTGDKSHVSASLMGTYGFCAPEYVRTKQLTIRADVYSFGVVLLELITGRKANDFTQPYGEHQVLVEWARCLCHKRDPCEFIKWADPRLQGRFPTRGLCQALAIASMCIQEDAAARPVIGDVMDGLSYLANQTYDPNPNAKYDSTRAKKWEGHAANRNWKARWMDKESNVADTET